MDPTTCRLRCMAHGLDTLPPALKKRRDIERRIPNETDDIAGPAPDIYKHPKLTLANGSVIDRSKPGPFADTPRS
jgi:hypothetical protein